MSPTQRQLLSNLVAYKCGAVVRRTIFDKSGRKVMVVAVDKNQAIGEHKTLGDALVEVFDGEAHVIIAGNDYELKRGDAIVAPSGVPHAIVALTPCKLLLTTIVN